MRKIMLFVAAALLSFVPVTFGVKSAQAVIGRPGTPFSYAGAHRRAMRRTYGVGWRYGGVAPYRYSARRFYGHPYHPIVRRHLYGAPGVGAYGSGLGYGYGLGWGAPGIGLGYGPGLGYGGFGGPWSGYGVRPGFGWGAPGFGWRRGWW